MKNWILIVLALLFIRPASGQKLFDVLVDKYSSKDGFSAVQLSQDMFELYLKKKNIKENDPVYQVIDNLENILVITQLRDAGKENELKSVQEEILSFYKKEGMDLFKTEKKSGSDLKIYIDKGDEGVSRLGLINLTDLSLTLIEINGLIDLANIASLGQAFNIRGLDNLRKIDDSGNYFYSSDFSNFTIPDIRIELSEERRKEIEKSIERAQAEVKARQFEMQAKQKEHIDQQKATYDKYKRFPILLSSGNEDAEYYINGKKADKSQVKELDPEKIEKMEVIQEKKNDKSVKVLKITTKK